MRSTLALALLVALAHVGLPREVRPDEPPMPPAGASPAERFFAQYDADGDGRLSRAEFPVWLAAFFGEIDADGDGFVDRREDGAYRRRPRGPRGRAARPPLPPATHAEVSYGPHPRNVLDVWQAEGEGPRPLVVYFHGGGFRGGDKRTLDRGLCRGLLEAGISVAAANYRLSSTAPFPAPMHDAARAVQFLRHHAARFRLDPARIGATGGSAGAGISLWLAFHEDLAEPEAEDPVSRESTRVQAAVVYAGQSTYDPREIRRLFDTTHVDGALIPFFGMQDPEDVEDPRFHPLFEEASPINHATADDAPVFLFYPQPNDPLPPGSRGGRHIHHPRFGLVLKEKLDALGVECVLRLREDVRERAPTEEYVAFFREHLSER